MGTFRLPTFRSECVDVELEECITSPFPMNPRCRAFKLYSSKVSIRLSSTTILLPIFADDISQYAGRQNLLNKNLVRVFCMAIYPAKSLDTAIRMYFYVVPRRRKGSTYRVLNFAGPFKISSHNVKVVRCRFCLRLSPCFLQMQSADAEKQTLYRRNSRRRYLS